MCTNSISSIRCGAVALALVLTFSVASRASAQSEPPPPGRIEFEEATRQYDAGNHQLALDGFTRARELMVEAGNANAPLVWFNIALCQEALGRDRAALTSFERFLSDAPADAPYRAQTSDRVRELRARLAAQDAGEDAQPRATSDETPAAAPTDQTDRPPVGPSSSSPLPTVGWIVVGIGALTALAAIPTGVLALEADSSLEAMCAGGACPGSASSKIDERNTLALSTDVLWGVGLSVAAVGLILALVGQMTGSEEREATSRATPTVECGRAGCVAGLAGSF